jgi:hypothetical protein
MAVSDDSERLALTDFRSPLRLALQLSTTAWLPYAILDIFGNADFTNGIQRLTGDFSVHVRLLIALPVLILARKFVHQKGTASVEHFLKSNLLSNESPGESPDASTNPSKRNQILESLHNITQFFQSKIYPFIPVLGVLVFLLLRVSNLTKNWQGDWMNSEHNPPRSSLAQLWLVWVSLPLYQYLLLDWIFRIGGWTLVLWTFSKVNLRINPLHPDGKGGLAFLAIPQLAYSPLCFAIASVVVADQRASFRQADAPYEALLELGLTILIPSLFLFLGPLLLFTPQLLQKKNPLLLSDALLGGAMTSAFQRRWIDPFRKALPASRPPPLPENVLDRSDSCVFVDYTTTFKHASRMGLVLFDRYSVIPFAVAILIPIAVLLLARVPLREVIQVITKVAM